MRYAMPILISMIALAGCADESRTAPISTSSGNAPASKEPEAANSLPLGSAVSAPLTPQVGTVNTVRVGPAAVAGASGRTATSTLR